MSNLSQTTPCLFDHILVSLRVLRKTNHVIFAEGNFPILHPNLPLGVTSEEQYFSAISTDGLSIPPVLLFTKDQNAWVESNGDCSRKVKIESKVKV